MLRKMALIAAAIAMPVGLVVATGASASAAKVKPPPDPPVTCSLSATITFAPPGISKPGSISSSKTSVTTTSPFAFGGGCTGGGSALAITSKSVKCSKKIPGTPTTNTACEPGSYGYGSWSNFATGGTSSIQKAVKKFNFTINGISYETKTTSSSEVIEGACRSDVGFQINGTVKAPKIDKGQTSTTLACLGSITGTGLNPGDNFFAAAVDETGTVATAQVDPAVSTVSIS